MKFAIIASGNGGFSKALYNNIKILSNAYIEVIIADRKCGAYRFFKNHTKIPTYLFNYSDYDKKDEYEKDILDLLKKFDIDFIVLNYNRLIGTVLLNAYNNKIINLHMSLLPLFKGFGAVKKAYDSDVLFYGSSIHIVDDSIDGGPIIAQLCIAKNILDDKNEFLDRLFKKTVLLFIDVIYKISNDKLVIKGKKCYFKDAIYGVDIFNPSLSIDEAKVIIKK